MNVLLRARVVLPISRPPIDDGAVLISGNRIQAVARFGDLNLHRADSVIDLGDAALLPGLVNAHCHLDYTSMAGQITPAKSFVDWIKTITTAKSGMIYADFAESWLKGAKMLLRTGTTTVADIEAVPELLPEVWEATPLRVYSFLEMTGVKSRRQPRLIVDEAIAKIETLTSHRCQSGLSPHAPYSTVPELLRLSATESRRRGWRLVTHVAESADEFDMFLHGRGLMFDWLKRNERDMSDCGLGSPVQQLERAGYLDENLLAVHANYLEAGDAELLSSHRVSIAHCPRSHAFFEHRRFPLRELTAAGVKVSLGTDSLATVRKVRGQPLELDMFAEMQAFADAFPELPPEAILRAATLGGARALGMQGLIGELSERAFADVIAVPFSGDLGEAYGSVVNHRGDVLASMIDGQWAIEPK